MKNKQLSLLFFLIIQLYLFAMIVNFNSFFNTKILSILSIFICLIIGVFMFCKTKDYYIMIAAIFLTLIADLVYLFLNDSLSIYLTFLNIIQIFYFLRTYLESDYKKENLTIRFSAIIIGILLGYVALKNQLDIPAILWIIYFINIFISILFTIKEIGLNNLFPIGLIFLFIHASLIMLFSLEDYTIINIPLVNFLQELSFDIKTAVYLPAQVILTCSIFTVNRRSFSKIPKEDN